MVVLKSKIQNPKSKIIKIKICGITNLEDALASINAGTDALGFIFYKKSSRYITPEKAKQITKHIPRSVKKVGVFVNEKEQNIKRIAKDLKLDILQFHGNESPEFLRRFKDYKTIKAFRIKDKNSLKNLKRYSVWAFLFDRYQKNLFGGTGKRFNWQLLRNLDRIKHPIFLSGGLDARNVKEAIKQVRPDWLDVSSSVEKEPGKKDYKKVKKFIETVRKLR